jgi:phosphoribosylformylglycinamidine synthase II
VPIEVRVFHDQTDPLADELRRHSEQLGVKIEVETNRVFYLDGVSDQEAQNLATNLLSDPATQHFDMSPRTDWDNERVVEVSPLPATTNPERGSMLYGAQLLGVTPSAVGSGIEYRFGASVSHADIKRVVSGLLVNKTVEQVRQEAPTSLAIVGSGCAMVEMISISDLDDDELLRLSASRKVALNLNEMKSIQTETRRMGRELRDGEIEYLGAAWSEHCCHKTTNAPIIISGIEGFKESGFSRIKASSTPYFAERGVTNAYGDNSGVWLFYDGTAINIKLETHNSPHMIEPRGGAATGTGGVLRDINETGLGSKPISSMHMSFIAPPDIDPNLIPSGTLSPTQLITGSVRGVGGYGNPLGVQTNNGSFHTHPNYRGKSSILVGGTGIMKEKNMLQGHPIDGDLVMAVGARTGLDGIHGATFSSESADGSTSSVHSGAVQIGDPIAEKKMFDAILTEASERGLIRAMTDCGAAGFASAIGELGEDIGVRIDLAFAPLKYSGLEPWEIFMSESQERAVLAIAPENLDELKAIFEKHNSEATFLGIFGNQEVPHLDVRYEGQPVVYLNYDFIKNGRVDEPLVAEWTPQEIDEIKPGSNPVNWVDTFTTVLSDWNVCSKETITRRYDHEVQGISAMKSYSGVHGDAPNNAAVMIPIPGKPYALIQAHGCNPALTDLDPTRGSVWSYVEAMSNFVAVGGNPDDAIIVNNYISATPTPRVMGALDASIDALAECVHEFRSPIISGKDSLSSTYNNADGSVIESPYNLIITVAGKIPDVKNTVSTDIKKPGSTLVMIGRQDYSSMGGSVYYDNFGGSSAKVPYIDIEKFHATSTALHSAIQSGKVLAAHDVSEGGVAVTLAEMLFGGDCGAEITVDTFYDPETYFFNETAGCFVVEVDNKATAEILFGNIPHTVLGTTKVDKTLVIDHRGVELPAIDIDDLKKAWKRPLEEVFA